MDDALNKLCLSPVLILKSGKHHISLPISTRSSVSRESWFAGTRERSKGIITVVVGVTVVRVHSAFV